MYSRDSRYFAANCPRKLKAAAGQVEVTPFRDSGKGKEVENMEGTESGTVQSSAIQMAIVLDTNFLCQ
jgi:hypothetical protein